MHKVTQISPENRLSVRFLRAFKASGIESLRRLAEVSDNSASQIRNIASGKFDSSSSGPGVIALSRAAKAMGVTVDDLISPKVRKPPVRNINTFFSRYRGPDTDINEFQDLLPFCDVYGKPSRDLTHLLRVGPRSLLAERTGVTDAAILQAAYEGWGSNRRWRIYERQMRAWDLGFLSEPDFFSERFDGLSLSVSLPFLLAACRVRDFDGSKVLLVCCEALRK